MGRLQNVLCITSDALVRLGLCQSSCPSCVPLDLSFASGSRTYLGQDIRDAHDAHVVLEAVRQNVLPLIKRRLLSTEREQLQSGHVYVWEEAQDDGGLLRWTDGRRWLVLFTVIRTSILFPR
jgi:hypothetical protein